MVKCGDVLRIDVDRTSDAGGVGDARVERIVDISLGSSV